MNQKINEPMPTSWNNTYLLDIPMIDKQHFTFFKIFDNLILLNTETDNYDKMNEVILELENYTHNHFNTEEALMRKANVSNMDFHIMQHGLFKKKVAEFKIAYSYKNSVLMEQLISFMRKWFLMHISEVDKNYADSVKDYLKNKEHT